MSHATKQTTGPTPEDHRALSRVHECWSDCEGHDVPEEQFMRLVTLGWIRKDGFRRWEMTDAGMEALNA